jgi:hypothetical protein
MRKNTGFWFIFTQNNETMQSKEFNLATFIQYGGRY